LGGPREGYGFESWMQCRMRCSVIHPLSICLSKPPSGVVWHLFVLSFRTIKAQTVITVIVTIS
jgi:hypothetical protein